MWSRERNLKAPHRKECEKDGARAFVCGESMGQPPVVNNCEEPERMNEPASRSGDRDVEASAIVGHVRIVDAQEKRPSFLHVDGLALPNKEETTWHNANPRHVLGAIERVEALA